ncbi:LysR family transcriptional regulator [Rhodobacterales bacterium HKCCE3408]|nr:LysR family transcriptional regulator [Rhodobacterales bacterium HKCCE3408]
MVALREIRQISGAAAQIAMTQPAASRLLSELEDAVGAKLYHRHPRGVTLTRSGEILADRAQTILRLLDDSRAEIADIETGTRGLVRIGAVSGPALEIVLPVIRELRVTFPEIEIGVDVDTSDKLAESLLARNSDFYIGRLPDGVDARAVEMEEIGEEPASLIVRSDHPLTRQAQVTLEDCLAHDWVMQNPGGLLRRTAEAYLLRKGYAPPARILSTSSLLLTLAIISQTSAIAPVAQSVALFYSGEDALGGKIRTLDVAGDMVVVPFSLVSRARDAPTAAAARVFSAIRARAGLGSR